MEPAARARAEHRAIVTEMKEEANYRLFLFLPTLRKLRVYRRLGLGADIWFCTKINQTV